MRTRKQRGRWHPLTWLNWVLSPSATAPRKVQILIGVIIPLLCVWWYVNEAYTLHSIAVAEQIEVGNDPALARNGTVPLPGELLNGLYAAMFDPNSAAHLWRDLSVTMSKFAIAWMLLICCIFFGATLAVLPVLRWFFGPILVLGNQLVAFMAIPLLFVTIGTGNHFAIAVVLIGTMFSVVGDAQSRASEIKPSLRLQTESLAASGPETVLRYIRYTFWQSYDSLRLGARGAFSLLLMGEQINGGSEGIGVNTIMLARKGDLSLVLPYVLMVLLLLFLADRFQAAIVRRRLARWHPSYN